MDFGTFVCSNWAGILRELSYKIKGTGVIIFSEKDINFIGQNGNLMQGKFDWENLIQKYINYQI